MKDNPFLELFAKKEATRFKLKVGVFLFLIQDNQILLLKRSKTGIDDGIYVVPMGGHDGKENLTSSLIREAKEEANVIIKPENTHVCHVMHRWHPMPQGLSFEQMDLFFKVEHYEGIISNMEPHKCEELKFYPINHLPTNTAPFIRQAIECSQTGQLFSEFGWDFQRTHK